MNDIQCLSHMKLECYHILWILQYWRNILYAQLRQNVDEVFHEFARQKESRIVEGYLQPDRVGILILIPPKYSVS